MSKSEFLKYGARVGRVFLLAGLLGCFGLYLCEKKSGREIYWAAILIK